MGSGKRLDSRTRYLLFKFLGLKGQGVDWVWDVLFDSDPCLVKRKYLVDRRAFFLINKTSLGGRTKIALYLAGNKNKGGRRKQLAVADAAAIEKIIQAHDDWTDKQIAEFFGELMNGDPAYTSPDTVRRCRVGLGYNLLVYDRVCGLANRQEQQLHYHILRKTHEDNIINFDATHSGKSKWKKVKGKGKKGQRLKKREWTASSSRFMILAGYTTRGFVFARALQGSVTHLEIEAMIRECLDPVLLPNDCVICDNASVHTVPSTAMLLDQVTRGRFKRVPAYSPRLSPVERGFALVWRRVCSNEKKVKGGNALKVIMEAFHYYSVGQPGGVKARNHFRAYKNNHAAYLASL